MNSPKAAVSLTSTLNLSNSWSSRSWSAKHQRDLGPSWHCSKSKNLASLHWRTEAWLKTPFWLLFHPKYKLWLTGASTPKPAVEMTLLSNPGSNLGPNPHITLQAQQCHNLYDPGPRCPLEALSGKKLTTTLTFKTWGQISYHLCLPALKSLK